MAVISSSAGLQQPDHTSENPKDQSLGETEDEDEPARQPKISPVGPRTAAHVCATIVDDRVSTKEEFDSMSILQDSKEKSECRPVGSCHRAISWSRS